MPASRHRKSEPAEQEGGQEGVEPEADHRGDGRAGQQVAEANGAATSARPRRRSTATRRRAEIVMRPRGGSATVSAPPSERASRASRRRRKPSASHRPARSMAPPAEPRKAPIGGASSSTDMAVVARLAGEIVRDHRLGGRQADRFADADADPGEREGAEAGRQPQAAVAIDQSKVPIPIRVSRRRRSAIRATQMPSSTLSTAKARPATQADLGIGELELGLYRLDQHVHDDPVDEAAGGDRGEHRERPARRAAQPAAERPRMSRFTGRGQ